MAKASAATRFLNPYRFLRPGGMAVLSQQYVPEELPHREDDLRKLDVVGQAVFQGGSTKPRVIMGPSGVGKTVLLRAFLKDVNTTAEAFKDARVRTAYVDLSKASTTGRALVEIAKQVANQNNQPIAFTDTGYAEDKYQELLLDILTRGHKQDVRLIVGLDEVDKHRDFNGLLKRLSRLYASHERVTCTPIMVTNDSGFHQELKAEVRSSLGEPANIEIPPYTAEALEDILMARVKEAFLTVRALESGVLSIIATKVASRDGDARRALDVLQYTVEAAESDPSSSKVTEAHVEIGFTSLPDRALQQKLETMPPQKKSVLAALCSMVVRQKQLEGGESSAAVPSMKAFAHYRATLAGTSVQALEERTWRDLLLQLQNENLVDGSRKGRGQAKGAEKKYALQYPPETVRRLLVTDPMAARFFLSPSQLK